MHLLCVHRAEHLQIGRSDGLFSGGGGGNYSPLVLTPLSNKRGRRHCAPALSRHCVARLNPLRGSFSNHRPIKKPQPCRVEVLLLVEAAGIIRPSSSPLRGRRRCAPALSHHFVVRLNPLRGFIPSSSQKPKKATLSGDLFWFFGGGGGN